MKQEMEYIYTIYKEGSISKAAEKLFMTQPALSMAVKRVESELNDVLFDRSRHPLKLTKVGRLYIQKYNEMKLLEKELVSQVNDLHNLEQGELLIGGTHFLLSYILAPLLSEFSNRYPNIDIQLFESSSDQLDSLLLSGKIDLCLKCDTYDHALKPIDFAFRDYLLMAIPKSFISQYGLPDNGLTREMIINDDYLQPEQPFLSFDYLRKLPYLVLTKGNNLHDRFLTLFQQNDIEPNIKMKIEQIVTAYHFADNGLGASLTSAMIVKKSVSSNLMYYKIDSPLMIRDFYVIGHQKRYISKANMKFIELLKDYYT